MPLRETPASYGVHSRRSRAVAEKEAAWTPPSRPACRVWDSEIVPMLKPHRASARWPRKRNMAQDNGADKIRGVLGDKRRDLVPQYFPDHIFLYRCNQNLPHKLSDP